MPTLRTRVARLAIEDLKLKPQLVAALRRAGARGELVLHLATRGNRYEIKVYQDGDTFDAEMFTSGRRTGAANNYNHFQMVNRIGTMVADAAEIDGINYRKVMHNPAALNIRLASADLDELEDVLGVWEDNEGKADILLTLARGDDDFRHDLLALADDVGADSRAIQRALRGMDGLRLTRFIEKLGSTTAKTADESEDTAILEDMVGSQGAFKMMRIWEAVQNLGTRYDRMMYPERYDPVRNFITRARRERFDLKAISHYVTSIQGGSLPRDWKRLAQEETNTDAKFEKGKDVPLSEMPDKLQDNAKNPPPAAKALRDKLKGKKAFDRRTLDQLVELAADSSGYTGKAQATREVTQAADKFERAVSKALSAWIQKYPPADGAGVEDLMAAKGTYLVYMTLAGSGVGIWDGEWDQFYRDTTKLETFLERAVEREYRFLENAIEDAAYETAGEGVD